MSGKTDNIFAAAESILGAIEKSDWVMHEIPAGEKDHPYKWKYAYHPPLKSRQETGYDLRMCEHCSCIVEDLRTPYEDYRFWCLHCGPQKYAQRLDR